MGHEQARATATYLAGLYPRARLVTCDLQRARQTMAPLLAAFAQDEAEEDARLRERHFGAWEGHLRHEVAQADPDRWQRWTAGEDVIAEVGGESRQQLVDRVQPVFSSLLEATDEGSVTIAVTHGGSVWHGLHALFDVPSPLLGSVDNCSLTFVARDEDTPMLKHWNEVGHLAGVAPPDQPGVGRIFAGRAEQPR